jgi:demethoxyubiquinone hydroxylase (CLK1/Coq7/Cat5 family)
MTGERALNPQQTQFRDNELNHLETMIENGFPKHRSQVADLITAIEKYLS